MNWKKFAKKSLELVELVSQLGTSTEEKKQQAMQDVESMYDAAYSSGQMSYSTAEAYKDEFRYSIGLERKD